MAETAETSPREPRESAAVIVCREQNDHLQILLMRRNASLAFYADAWAFPGGKVDPQDRLEQDDLQVARRAAVRELAEEAQLSLPVEGLEPFTHWTTPVRRRRRYATWFFVARLPDDAGPVVHDGEELVDHHWWTPCEALSLHQRQQLRLPPPTFVTLTTLQECRNYADVLRCRAGIEQRSFRPIIVDVPGGECALYHGDVAYAGGDLGAAGARHRLWMNDPVWRYQTDSHT